jgi:hypothetical protein
LLLIRHHPLLVFDGRDGFPLAAVLRPGNTHSSRGALAVLKRLIQNDTVNDNGLLRIEQLELPSLLVK